MEDGYYFNIELIEYANISCFVNKYKARFLLRLVIDIEENIWYLCW